MISSLCSWKTKVLHVCLSMYVLCRIVELYPHRGKFTKVFDCLTDVLVAHCKITSFLSQSRWSAFQHNAFDLFHVTPIWIYLYRSKRSHLQGWCKGSKILHKHCHVITMSSPIVIMLWIFLFLNKYIKRYSIRISWVKVLQGIQN